MCATPVQPVDAPAADAPESGPDRAASIHEGEDGEPAHHEDEPPSPSREPERGVELSVCIDDPEATPDAVHAQGWLSDHMAQALQRLAIRRGSLDVVVVGDELMAQLHEQYKNVPGTTDVLTFDLSEAEMADKQDTVEAELVLCFDEAARRAEEHGHEPRQEMLLYAVHGLMHLLDEDDQDPEAAARMHRREDDLLEQMGQGRLYGTTRDQ